MSIEENKALVRRLEQALNSGAVDAGIELFAAEFLFNGQRIGRHDLVRIRASLWDAVPDVRWTIDDMAAEGDAVASFCTVQGTHQRDFAHPALGSAPASGKPIRYTYAVLHRIVDGQIVEARDVSDRLALLVQLGVIPAPGAVGS